MFKKIFHKIKPSYNISYHTTDIHSHLIPSIDDGLKTLTTSIEIIKRFQDFGFKKIITTPHIKIDKFPNTQDIIYKNYELLQNELQKQNINIKLKVAAEYYYDEYFVELIHKKEILTFGNNYILFEFSNRYKPFQLEMTLSKLLEAGYKPVLAHPERYYYYHTEEHYKKLKDLGLLFQINAISTQGFYGKKVEKNINKIIDLGLVDFIGSDIHNQQYMDIFIKTLQSKNYLKILKKNNIQNDYL
ncbi:Capsular polysaccharide synthesis enzyme Cap8C; Manganese-dependent protein-tyrosine phosphatase [hydrothermal vent metagenome]|uniref:Capsular polysaccharide synthesis enzyme Cap8C Manganese-dependent protein-tyrosine phosphatase n=1 Tax=hydrothermal vent metagenome TaxID=652676 RepID=A0A1W1D4F7_9ZZZZ